MGHYLKEIMEHRRAFEENYNQKKYADAIDEGNKIIEIYKENNATDTEGYADDVNNFAILLDEVHISERAKGLYKEAAKIKKEILGEDSESYLDTLTNLGVLLSSMGDFAEAEEILETARDGIRDNEGDNSLKYVRSLYNLGNMYADKTEYEKAINVLDKSLEKAKKLKDIPKGEFEDIHVSIADACRRYGNFRRAREEYAKAVKLSEEEESEDSFFKMTYYLSASVTLQKCEKYKEAAEIYEKAVAIRERIMDINHLDFISVLNNLAVIYNKDGNSKKAIEVHERVLKLVENMLGRDHVFYGDVITNLGVDYYIDGDSDKSIEYHNKALEIKKKIVGEKHIHYIWTLISLAEVYEKMEKFDMAAEVQNKALELRRECFGEINEQICDSLVNLGRIAIKNKEYVKAQGFLMQALIMSKEVGLAEGIPVKCTAENVYLLAEASCKLKEIDKVEQFCESLIDYRKSEKGDKHPRYAKALYDSAVIYAELENYEKAAQYMGKACPIAETMVGSDTVFCMDCFYLYSEMLYKMKDYEKAVEILKKTASMYRKNDSDFEKLIKIMYMQAKCQYMLGFPRKAEEIVFRIDGIVSRSENDFFDIVLKEKADYAFVINICCDHKKAGEMFKNIYDELKNKSEKPDYTLLVNCAETLLMSGDKQSAAKIAAEAEETANNSEEKAKAVILEARSYKQLGQEQKASEILEDIISVIGQDSTAYMEYAGEIYCLLGECFSKTNVEKAMDYLDKGIKEAKVRQNIPIEEYRGYLIKASNIAIEQKNYQKAIELLSENALLIRRDSGETIDFAQALEKAAELYEFQDRISDAQTIYEKCSELYEKLCGKESEKYINAVYKLLKAKYADKKYDEVAVYIENMTIFGDRKKDFYDLLALTYKNMGAIGKLFKLKIGKKS